jgi:hypothetical protein
MSSTPRKLPNVERKRCHLSLIWLVLMRFLEDKLEKQVIIQFLFDDYVTFKKTRESKIRLLKLVKTY